MPPKTLKRGTVGSSAELKDTQQIASQRLSEVAAKTTVRSYKLCSECSHWTDFKYAVFCQASSCKKENRLICMPCLLKNHKGHEYIVVTEEVLQNRFHCRDVLLGHSKSAKDALEKIENGLKRVIGTINKQSEEIKSNRDKLLTKTDVLTSTSEKEKIVEEDRKLIEPLLVKLLDTMPFVTELEQKVEALFSANPTPPLPIFDEESTTGSAAKRVKKEAE